MDPYQPSNSARFASRKRELPSGYASIGDVLAGTVPLGRLVSVMGLVKDYQVPIRTNGSDYKCTITIYDKSIEYDVAGLPVSIFRPKDAMPEPTAGDVLVINSAKVQSYRESISLITNRSTLIHIYTGSDIPRPPLSAEGALRSLGSARKPGQEEHEYVSWLYHHIDKKSVPDAATFQEQVDQSGHKKDKYCKLEDVVDGKFCDVIVNVVKAPFDDMEKTTLWVSDYTENDSFHKFSWDGANQLGGRDGDPYGYLDTDIHAATKWACPFGRRSMQITCFEPHASYVNSEVHIGQWIQIRNLRIKTGRNGLNLEGVLHGDSKFSRRQVHILGLEAKEECDPRLKEAIRRKKEYEKLKKKQMKSLAANESGENTGTKRKVDNSEEEKPNSKARRKEKREVARGKIEEQDRQTEERLGLNKLIKCESQEQPLTPLPFIIEPVSWKTTVEGEKITLMLPFACAKYRTNVRVVDFRPRKLENFATWRKSTESDVLSDYSSDSDSGSEDEDPGFAIRYTGKKMWEWRFALQLEDADPKSKEKSRLWAVVDNIEAQQLTGMDACDLRADPDALNGLREQLFKLWGNLEEAKRQEQRRQITNLRRVAAKQPPPSSPVHTDIEHLQRGSSGAGSNNQNGTELSNKPFACCIRQYGVRVREPNSLRADAGEGHRWERIFGLFGTKICL